MRGSAGRLLSSLLASKESPVAYPTDIDSIPDPTPTNRRNAPSLANGQVAQNSAIEAIQNYVGVQNSAVSGTVTKTANDALAATVGNGTLYIAGQPYADTAAVPTPRLNDTFLVQSTGVMSRYNGTSWVAAGSLPLGSAYVWASSSGAINTAANFAYKGAQFTPTANLSLVGLQVYVNANLPVTSIVSGALITVSAGAIATITNTATTFVTPGGGAWAGVQSFQLYFASPITLVGGTTYGLIAGYNTTAGGVVSTTSFPVLVAPVQEWNTRTPRPGTVTNTVLHIASNVPVVGTAVSTATNQGAFGTGTYSVAPIISP